MDSRRTTVSVAAAARTVLLVAALAFGAASNAMAQAFPSKPVRILVGFAPGGAMDIGRGAGIQLTHVPYKGGAPAIAESGYPGFEASVWHAFIAPRGTPPAVVEKAN